MKASGWSTPLLKKIPQCFLFSCLGLFFHPVIADAQTGTFSATGTVIAGRGECTATLLPDGRVLVAGGYTGPNSLASAELYDPTTGTFSATGSMITPRYSHAATLLLDGQV